jgi:hypothetical protein
MSTKAQRFTQHRKEREPKQASKHLRHLKGENHKLAKTVSRLKKELEKATVIRNQFESEDEPTEQDGQQNEQSKIVPVCKCSSVNVVVIEVIGRTYAVCKDCKYRWRIGVAA